jgi:hypothetical protein
VACKYENTAGTSITATPTVVPFAVAVYDTHSAFVGATGVFTAPMSGKYQVISTMDLQSTAHSASNSLIIRARKNNTYNSQIGRKIIDANITSAQAVQGTTIVSLLAGETLSVDMASSTTASMSTASGNNQIMITRIGN